MTKFEEKLKPALDFIKENMKDCYPYVEFERPETVAALMMSWHEYQIKNNADLSDVIICPHPFEKVISGDFGDFCTECNTNIGSDRL